MITMVLGGLWHGASWNFVLWGALHGGALAVTRMVQRARGTAGAERAPGEAGWSAGRFVATVATFHFVCFAWVFFRAPSFAHATLALGQIAHGTWALDHVTVRVIPVVALALLLHFVPRDWENRMREAFVRTPAIVQGVVLAAAAVALHVAASAKPEPFVYGQF